MAQYDLVLFDMDGTLVDSEQTHRDMFCRFWQAHYPGLYDEETRGKTLANTPHKSFENMGVGSKDFDEVFCRLEEFYTNEADDLIKNLRFVEHTQETVERLKAGGVLVGIATNSANALVKKVIAVNGMEALFDLVVGFDRSLSEKPVRFGQICEELSVPRQRVLYVGDSEHDPMAAEQAGIDCCVLYSPIGWVESEGNLMRSHMPDYIVKDIGKVAAIAL